MFEENGTFIKKKVLLIVYMYIHMGVLVFAPNLNVHNIT